MNHKDVYDQIAAYIVALLRQQEFLDKKNNIVYH